MTGIPRFQGLIAYKLPTDQRRREGFWTALKVMQRTTGHPMQYLHDADILEIGEQEGPGKPVAPRLNTVMVECRPRFDKMYLSLGRRFKLPMYYSPEIPPENDLNLWDNISRFFKILDKRD